jgi:DNA transposition AAA+ family ATPase
MLLENEQEMNVGQFPPIPLSAERWESIRNRIIDELARGGRGLKDFAPNDYDLGRLELWLKEPPSEYVSWGARIGAKSASVQIAETLEKRLSEIEAIGTNKRHRCPVRVETAISQAIFEGVGMARSLCEFVEIAAPPGVGKTEGKNEVIARTRKAEGFFCPVWNIELDETCISIKNILQLLSQEILGAGRFDPKNEFEMNQAIIEATEGKGGVLLVDEGQHLADIMKKMGIPIVNLLRRFVDRGLFGIVYFGNGEIYRRLSGKGEYTQLLSRMQDFRLELKGYGASNGRYLTRDDVLAVAAAWGVTGAEESAYCLKAASQPGALRTMTNIFRRAHEAFGVIDIRAMKKIREF